MDYSFRIYFTFILYLLVAPVLISQDAGSESFYSNIILSNPAYTGASGNGTMVLSYRDFYPGYHFGTGNIYGSWDSFIGPLHGGAGLYIMDNRLGDVLNDIRLGGTYAYHLRAGQDLFINAGFMASVIHRSLNAGNIILPDQIDPLLGPILISGEVIDSRSRTVFDTGIGFLVIFRNYTAGISLNHIASPDLSGTGNSDGRLPRKFTLNSSAEFNLKNSLALFPILTASMQGSFMTFSTGCVMTYKVLSINMIVQTDSNQGISVIQTGIFVDQGRVGLGYSHYFNTGSYRSGLPSSLSAQVTVRIGLYNVDKSDIIHAIKYPKL